MTSTNCQARQYSDQMQCDRCGLQWDINDSDPPDCKQLQGIERAKAALAGPHKSVSYENLTNTQLVRRLEASRDKYRGKGYQETAELFHEAAKRLKLIENILNLFKDTSK